MCTVYDGNDTVSNIRGGEEKLIYLLYSDECTSIQKTIIIQLIIKLRRILCPELIPIKRFRVNDRNLSFWSSHSRHKY